MEYRDVWVVSAFSILSALSYLFFDTLGPFNGNYYLDAFMELLSQLGGVYIYFALGGALVGYAFLYGRGEMKQKGAFFMFALLVDTLLILALKDLIGRERPIPETHYTKAFPSGHAANGIFTAKMLGDWYPKFRGGLYAFMLLCVSSRIYFGAHYLSDIFAGFAISYGTAVLWMWVYGKYVEKSE
ncbi:MAG: phosphatase PAP2 family protein [archaeon]